MLLVVNDKDTLHETKKFIVNNFEMKDLSETSFVLEIHIHRDYSRDILRLSQKSYIENVLKRYDM